jgi:hypothetical protein
MSHDGRRHDAHPRLMLVAAVAIVVAGIAVTAFGLRTMLPWQAAPLAAAAQGPSPADSSLRGLIEALLPPASGGATVRLLPGQLPPDLPFTVSLPPGSRLVGSIVRTSDPVTGPGISIALVDTTEIAFDALGSPEELFAFFDDVLTPQGWHDIHFRRSSNGFLPDQAARMRTYCADEPDHVVSLTVNPAPEGPNDVRLHISRQTLFSSCAEPLRTRGGGALAPGGSFTEPFPPLYAPAGARLGMGDRSSRYGGTGGQEHIPVETPLSIPDLAAHYEQQLATAGWIGQARDVAPEFAWSTWRLPADEADWQGLFFVSAGAAPDERWLYLRIEATMPAPREGPGDEG